MKYEFQFKIYEQKNIIEILIQSWHLEWFEASIDGDVATVDELISLGFNVNAVSNDSKYSFY